MSDKTKGLPETAKSLLNECKGVLSLAERELRAELGNTNVAVLKAKMDELETALAAAPAGTAHNELSLVRLVLSAHQTAYAKFHNGEGRGVIEADQMAIGYASVELAKALATPSPQAPPEQCNAFSTTSAREQSAATASDILRVGRAIYLQTKNWTFGISYPQSVDATSWAVEVVRRGLGVEWATDWIHRGYPEVPQWIMDANQPVAPAATQEQSAGSGALRAGEEVWVRGNVVGAIPGVTTVEFPSTDHHVYCLDGQVVRALSLSSLIEPAPTITPQMMSGVFAKSVSNTDPEHDHVYDHRIAAAEINKLLGAQASSEIREAPPDADTGFHAQDRWMFKRMEDGSVRILRGDVFVVLPENSWASVVCSVSKLGETHSRWQEIRFFHGTEGIRKWNAHAQKWEWV